MHTSQLIDHVSTTAQIDDARDAMLATADEGSTISLLGFGGCIPISRAARQVRTPRSDALVVTGATWGARPALGSPRAAALNAESGARKAASATAAKGPVGHVREREVVLA